MIGLISHSANSMSFKNSPPNWRLKASKEVYSNYYMTLYEDKLDLDGKEKVYLRGKRRDYSTIVPFVSQNEILMIKSYRHLVDSVQIEVPSGYIEPGESPEQAALRELEEETGFKAKRIVLVGSYTLDYSMFEQTGNVFAAYDLAREGKTNFGRMEKIESSIKPIKEIEELLFNGTILNAASIVALYRALDYHNRSYARQKEST
jgi:ADP-ribose pyrophosphatase